MQFFKGMAEGGKNGGEVFGNGFAAAGAVVWFRSQKYMFPII